MADAHADISKHMKLYIGVFVALAILTIVTVAASRVDLGHTVNIALALAIAVFKASLVAAIFMHLKWEKTGWIWWPLAICAVLFVTLMALPALTTGETETRAHVGMWDSLPSHEAAADEGHDEGEH